ncbi:MAG: WGxxGxxG family protein [Kovacikia sp.]
MKSTISKVMGATALAIGLTVSSLPASAQTSPGTGTTGSDSTSAAPAQTTSQHPDFNWGWLGLLGLLGLAGLNGKKNYESNVGYREPDVRTGNRL